MFKVYHADNPTFGFSSQPQFPNEYTLVAMVEAESLDKVFELTNHITHDWRLNDGVDAFPEAERSTSVGDVVVDDNDIAYLCTNLGWEEIVNEEEFELSLGAEARGW